MKTKVFLFMLVCSVCGFVSCNDDDNYLPDDVVVRAFESKYPEAARVEWEVKGGYKVADFRIGTYDTEAWFQTNGEWIFTETDVRFDELPEAVKSSFSSGDYASWRVDDVDKLERADAEVVYVIEVEQGNQDIDLYYSESGILVKAISDAVNNNYEPLSLSKEIIDEVSRMYPGAPIYDFEREGVYIEVDILDGKVHKEVVFDNDGAWVYTEWEVRTSDVPEVVMATLNSGEYQNYRIDDVDIREKPDGLYYIFELESGNKEVYCTIKSDGTVVK